MYVLCEFVSRVVYWLVVGQLEVVLRVYVKVFYGVVFVEFIVSIYYESCVQSGFFQMIIYIECIVLFLSLGCKQWDCFINVVVNKLVWIIVIIIKI